MTGNPKSESRNPKKIRSAKSETEASRVIEKLLDKDDIQDFGASLIRVSEFGFLSDFGFLNSDFSAVFSKFRHPR
jgi:hypothetical protein